MNDDDPLAIAQSMLNDLHAIATMAQEAQQPARAKLSSAIFILNQKLEFLIEKLGGPKAIHDT